MSRYCALSIYEDLDLSLLISPLFLSQICYTIGLGKEITEARKVSVNQKHFQELITLELYIDHILNGAVSFSRKCCTYFLSCNFIVRNVPVCGVVVKQQHYLTFKHCIIRHWREAKCGKIDLITGFHSAADHLTFILLDCFCFTCSPSICPHPPTSQDPEALAQLMKSMPLTNDGKFLLLESESGNTSNGGGEEDLESEA